MDQQLECDQQLIQRKFKQMNEGEMAKCFIERTSSLPIVSGTTFYVSLTYKTVKDKNALFGSFMANIENFITKAASITIHATQKVVSFNYLDTLACKGLDKIEYSIPLIRKRWDEIAKDSREYILNKISGVSDSSETPSTIIDAVSKRKQSLGLWLSDILLNNKAGQTVISAFNKVLDKTESIGDFIFPNQDNKNCPKVGTEASIMQRISCITSKAKKSFLSLARKVNEEETGDKITAKNVALVTNHWLLQYYKKLQEMPEREGTASKVLRLSALSTVGAILTFNGVVAATLPRAENYVATVLDFIKNTSNRVLTPIKNSFGKTVGPAMSAFTKLLEMVRDANEEILSYVNKIYQNLPEMINKMTSSGLKLSNESFSPINETVVPQISSHSNSRASQSNPRAEVSRGISSLSNSLNTNKSYQDCSVTESSTPDFLSLLDSEEEKEGCEENLKENNVELLEESEDGFFCDANETVLLASGKDSSYGSSANFTPNFKVKNFLKWPKF